MELKELLNNLTDISKQDRAELLNTHPLQWLDKRIRVSVWKIKYSYTTNRGNNKEHTKYMFGDSNAWDLVENVFNLWIEEFNINYPNRSISNVKILDVVFMDEFTLSLD